MDLARSFSYVTEDQEWWKKILLGGVISLIPVVGQIYLMGYALEALKNVIAGREVPLPEVTEDFGGKLLKGLLLSVIVFIYFLPVTVIGAGSGIGSALITNVVDDPDAVNAIVSIWSGCLGCISLILGIAIGLLMPFVWSRYAETEQFEEAFKLGEIFQMLKSNLGSTFVVLIVNSVAGLLAFFVGLIFCVIGLLFTMFYVQLVTVFLYGALYRQAKATALG
ncbi:MAG: DUF4013 domain-containing protein [Anaerolineae bacterium]|nr:DUF4013 domain-containing protein [Anaerolineae bacterium]